MAQPITIAGKSYNLADFKTSFTLGQAARAADLAQAIFDGDGAREIIGALVYASDYANQSTAQRSAAIANIVDKVILAKGFFSKPELRELFFVFFLPEGTAWNKEYAATIPARAAELEDVPMWPLVEAVKGFFSSKTIAVENSTTLFEVAAVV